MSRLSVITLDYKLSRHGRSCRCPEITDGIKKYPVCKKRREKTGLLCKKVSK